MPFEKGVTPEGAKPFKKGESGNPKGRPPGPSRATVYERLLKKKVEVTHPVTGEAVKLTYYEAIALGQMESALKGNTPAWKEIQDSLHGKQTDKSEIKAEIKHVVFEAIDGSSSDENPDE